VIDAAIAYFGTYAINEPEKTLLLKLQGSTYSNLLATPDQRRIVTSLTEEEFKLTNPKTPAGGTLHPAFNRAKGPCPSGGAPSLSSDPLVPLDLAAMHDPPRAGVERIAPVQHREVVPHQQVAHPPSMAHGKARLRRVRPQCIEQGVAVGNAQP